MEQFVGLDVSQQETHVCVVDRDGVALWRGTCASSPANIAAVIREKAPSAVRVGLETGPLATWHWHALKALDLPVICIDARHAKAVLSMQINKTDRNDAYGLAQIMRTGWYREVGVKSLDSHKVRAILGARAQLVGMRTDLRNQIRGLLKIFGIILERHGGKSFQARVMQVAQDDGIPGQSLQALLAILTSIERQLDRLNRIASDQARLNPICRNLMTIPGVGALTAVAFVAAIEDPRKFAKSTSVGAYFGLTPKRYQSGETDLSGRVSKCGDGLVRVYLYEAANSLLVGSRKWSSLKAWGMRIAKRSGMNKAKVAVARKLAVIMHQMWLTGEEFRWSNTMNDTAQEEVPAA
jgi:transposase